MKNESGNNQIHITDALNASLLKLKLRKGSQTLPVSTSDVKVYVDKQDKNDPSDERRLYVFPLSDQINFYAESETREDSDEFIMSMDVKNNDIVMNTYVKRIIGIENGEKYFLDDPLIETVESTPIILFEGENYIYTNYDEIDIELIYLENTETNKMTVNSAIYYNHKIKNDGEFSLDDIYFKDAFTKTEDKLNLEVDNANVSCITSKNNKFNLDEDGNLTVSSISCNDSVINALSVYPVGSIYLSVNNTNPSTLFGGTWQQIKDRFLLCSGDIYENGSIGGSANLQAHTHSIPSLSGTAQSNGAHNHTLGADLDAVYSSTGKDWSMHNNSPSGAGYTFYTGTQGAHTHNVTTNASTSGSTGLGSAENMPPYLVISAWQRTA